MLRAGAAPHARAWLRGGQAAAAADLASPRVSCAFIPYILLHPRPPQVIPTKDRLEGLAAFAEKRKPKFSGE